MSGTGSSSKSAAQSAAGVVSVNRPHMIHILPLAIVESDVRRRSDHRFRTGNRIRAVLLDKGPHPGSRNKLTAREGRTGLAGFAVLFSIVAASGCSDESDRELDDLASARALWSRAAPASYAFDYLRSCFCPSVSPVRIEVRDGLVVEVVDLDAAQIVPPERNEEYPTIEELFVELDGLIREEPYSLEVRYDVAFGFPAFVSVDIDERIADEEFSYTVDGFVRRAAEKRHP